MVPSQTYRLGNQQNKTEVPNMSICNISQLIFDKDANKIHWRKENILNKWCWETWIPTHRRMKLNPSITLKKKLT